MRQDGLARRNDSAGPAEADYDALCAALLATARGRAFLDEHARRARTADTALALEALTRLEDLLRQNQETAEAGARLRAELRGLTAAIASARASFDKFEGALAKRETVMALFDLLERRINELIGDLPELEPQAANENESASTIARDFLAAYSRDDAPETSPQAEAAVPAESVDPEALIGAFREAEAPEEPAAEPAIVVVAETIIEPAPAAEPVAEIQPEIFPDEIFLPFDYQPPEEIAEPASVAPPPITVAQPAAILPPVALVQNAPVPASETPPAVARADVMAQVMMLTPAERIALFS